MFIIVGILRFLAVLLLLAGAFFFIAATVGVIRMPDPYNRGHVAGKGDSPGFLFCLTGVWLYWLTISPMESLRILAIIIFMLFANPIAIHCVLRLCLKNKVGFVPGTKIIEEDN